MKKILFVVLALSLVGCQSRSDSDEVGGAEAPGANEAVTFDESAEVQPSADAEKTGIEITSPQANSVISFPLTITGEARGIWYFEATFGVKLVDSDGTVLTETYAQALDDWMQEGFVAFESTIETADPNTSNGKLVFEKVNMSGLPENDLSVEVPVKFQ